MTTEPKVIAFVGMSGVGKTDAAAMFAALGDFAQIYFGGVVMSAVKAKGMAPNEASKSIMRRVLREEHGMAAMAIVSQPEIDAALASGRNVLIDGLYSYSELKFLRAAYGDRLILIAIHARKSLRIERLAHRAVRPLTAPDMEARDAREIEGVEKAPPIALADFHIVNDEDHAALQAAMERTYGAIFG